MGKIICDVCGTTYPDTNQRCPICGCTRDEAADMLSGERMLCSGYGGATSRTRARC